MTSSGTEADTSRLAVDREVGESGRVTLRFRGALCFPVAATMWRQVREALDPAPDEVVFELSEVDAADSGTVALLVELHCRLEAEGRRAELVGVHGPVREILDLYEVRPPAVCLLPEPKPEGVFNQVGVATMELVGACRDLLVVLGSWVASALAAVRNPRLVNWRDIPRLIERAGADGLIIVAIINGLVGLIMAFQASMQLKQYGADIFVADLVALSVIRELGPLMTAIIVASRSGAAYTAEIGTMKVSEEIDALRTLGMDPVGYLVFPRLLALLVAVPLLTMFANLVAILGGLLTAVLTLDVTPRGYLLETQAAIDFGDLASSMIKSAVFGMAVAFISCQKGMATRGGAEGVGRSTTAAVVTILFALVALDAVFTVLFQFLRI